MRADRASGASPGISRTVWDEEVSMKWMLLPATALVVLAGCSPASDRGDKAAPGGTAGSETGMASTDTGMTGSTGSAGGTTPVATIDASGVLSQLAVADQTEIQQAKVAAKKASNPTVKEFANKLASDHKANSQK